MFQIQSQITFRYIVVITSVICFCPSQNRNTQCIQECIFIKILVIKHNLSHITQPNGENMQYGAGQHLSYATLSQSASSSRTKPNFRKQHPEVKSENPHLAAERHLTSLKSKQQKIHKVHTLSDHDLAPTLTNPTSHEGGD